MGSLSTGFPALDKLLEANIQPSYISLNTEFNADQRAVTLQLVYNLLKDGLRGLYVCFDRPANEVKSTFEKLNLNIKSYDNDYSIFFVDFFSESQSALIETEAVSTLSYQTSRLLGTLSPFLNWIKNGFIIVDSISTLTLNMKAKSVYEFVRGIKLLGRAFNLIVIGIEYRQVTDPKVMNLIASNADVTLFFKDEILYVNRYESTEFERLLLLSEDEYGKISLNSMLPREVNQRAGTEILSLVAKNPLKITPRMVMHSTPKTEFSGNRLLSTLETMVEMGILKTTPHCSNISCPYCTGHELEFYLQCPECENRVLEKGNVWEHFGCGYLDFESSFTVENGLICPKCHKPLKQIGVDYRIMGTGYRCSNKHVFSTPNLMFACLECNAKFHLNQAKIENQNIYTIAQPGQRAAGAEFVDIIEDEVALKHKQK